MSRDVLVATFATPLVVVSVRRSTSAPLSNLARIASQPMTDPTKDVALAIWWKRLKAAPADNVEKAKELCTSGKLKELAYDSLDVLITLLDTVGPLLPPPGKQ
ncbi:hypothetical protein HaLaN_17447 [Haematococcus lacustris]|uniref:Uncharacterized protein n=1 Tax=Haematococcus lacustris TaxID=44745 RepID=A0A699ZGN4_HAELA|nr:hypothetical protein HaLaN_17447 [Haematococcus lacustris]